MHRPQFLSCIQDVTALCNDDTLAAALRATADMRATLRSAAQVRGGATIAGTASPAGHGDQVLPTATIATGAGASAPTTTAAAAGDTPGGSVEEKPTVGTPRAACGKEAWR